MIRELDTLIWYDKTTSALIFVVFSMEMYASSI